VALRSCSDANKSSPNFTKLKHSVTASTVVQPRLSAFFVLFFLLPKWSLTKAFERRRGVFDLHSEGIVGPNAPDDLVADDDMVVQLCNCDEQDL
jgi:hypothetical protein